MTKRLTIALVALALFVLVAVMPVSAAFYAVAQNITQGATIYTGEQGLNVSPAQFGGVYNFEANGIGQPAGVLGAAGANTERDVVGWWASAANLQTSNPTQTYNMGQGQNVSLTVSYDQFGAYPGNWYLVNRTTLRAFTPAIFVVADPSLVIKVWDVSPNQGAAGADVTGLSVPQGQNLTFKVETNMINAIQAGSRYPTARDSGVWYQTGGAIAAFTTTAVLTNPLNDGYVDLKVQDESGTIYTALWNDAPTNNGVANTILQQNVSAAYWIWGQGNARGTTAMIGKAGNWSTGVLDGNGQYRYPIGTYKIWAESLLNNMKANYKIGGADYTGKTVSATQTVTLVSDTLKIQANKDSVVRSKTFSVTITGRPSTTYHLWVKDTNLMTCAFDNQPPMIIQNQAGVAMDPDDLGTGASYLATLNGVINQKIPGPAGVYIPQNKGTTYNTSGVYAQVAGNLMSNLGINADRVKVGNGTFIYANVTLSSSGTRTVEFTTTNWTKAQKYTIRVEQNFAPGTLIAATRPYYPDTANQFEPQTATYKSDEVDVKVEKGSVTIVAAGDQNYYLGEEIKFSGTNTETYQTFLFIMGPNLPVGGAQIQNTNPRANAVTDGQANTFQVVQVLGDNTWSWKWGTSTVALDAGTYTIYAVSQPRNAAGQNLANTAFGTVSIIIKKPFVSATASQSTVAQGDKLFITGTAEGNPVGVKMWILGKNFPAAAADVATESVNADASFKHEVTQAVTRGLYPGQYFVVVQHPMQNNVFDIDMCNGVNGAATSVCNLQQAAAAGGAQAIFSLLGASSLQGSDAAEALVQGINSPNVDDTYTKLQFLVEVPVITIAPVGDKHVGDKFTITASTNLAVDDEILVTVYSSSFKPTQKSQSGEFSGATGTVKVVKGDSGLNKITFDVDSSTFKPDEYIVQESAVLQVATGTALFNVLEGVPPTAVVTAVVTTNVPPVPTTAVATPVVTPPTPVPTTKSPGYGALIALIGLGAVAFVVVRRH